MFFVVSRLAVKPRTKEAKCLFTPIMAYMSEWPSMSLLMPFFTVDSLKFHVPKTSFIDIVTIQNHHATYVKHVLGSSYVFFTSFGNRVRAGRGWGGSPKGLIPDLRMQFFIVGS